MRRIVAISLATLVLAGCGKPREAETYRDALAVSVEKPAAPNVASPEIAQAPADSPAAAPAAMAADAPMPSLLDHPVSPMLAYAYTYAIDAPQSKVAGLQALHQRACEAAGPLTCQVISQSLTEADGGATGAALQLRATSAWLRSFRAGLDSQAKNAGGRVLKSSVDSEDLTRDIIDGAAELRAKTTLRDRLQSLLATHPGKVTDLLQVERELARVQSEIDTGQSELKVAQARVMMSRVTIDYSALHAVAVRSAWTPLKSAFGEFAGLTSEGLALMVRLLAILLPWAALIGLALFLLRKPIHRLALRKPSWSKA